MEHPIFRGVDQQRIGGLRQNDDTLSIGESDLDVEVDHLLVLIMDRACANKGWKQKRGRRLRSCGN